MATRKYHKPGLEFALGWAVEEAGELQQAIGKSMRFGFENFNPDVPKDQQQSNLIWVRMEMADVREALDNLDKELDAYNAQEGK